MDKNMRLGRGLSALMGEDDDDVFEKPVSSAVVATQEKGEEAGVLRRQPGAGPDDGQSVLRVR